MSLLDRFTSLIARGSVYEGPKVIPTGDSYEDGRERQMSMPRSITRWHLSDLEGAVLAADTGNMRIVGQLWRSMRRDGQIAGVLSTRCQGLIQLPMQMIGDDDAIAALAEDFAQVFPSAELALLDEDGVGCGVAVGEFVQIGDSLPVLRRLDPEFLKYIWSQDKWYYQSIHGFEEINPGDGRWVLHCPGGAVQPWSHGMWGALGRAFIAKEHAFFYRENYSNKLANAARVAISPQGTSETLKANWFQRVAQWGVNTVFDAPPGYDVKLIESNGRGYEVFQETIKTANEEIVITIAGQSVTTDGGSGFSNTAIHAAIRGDLIQADANSLAMTLNSQCIPVWAEIRLRDASRAPVIEWDVTGSADLVKDASAMQQAANAVTALNLIAGPLGKQVDFEDIARRYGVKLVDTAPPASSAPALPSGDASNDVDASPDEEPSQDQAAALAEKMTTHGIARCEHGSLNVCRKCGIERVRDFTINDQGEHVWTIGWQAISKPGAALVALPGGKAVA